MPPPDNPYAKRKSIGPQNEKIMGPQSQRRLTLTERTNQLKSNSNKNKRKGGQLTLTGEVAFDPITDCSICKARHIGYAEPHRGHHPLCWNNKRTKGITSEATLVSNKEARRLKDLFSKPVQRHEIFTTRNNSREAGQRFFEPVLKANTTTTSTMATSVMATTDFVPKPEHFCGHVMTKVEDESFVKEHSNKEAPLPFIALASYVQKTMLGRRINQEAYNKCFHLGRFVVPATNDMHNNPHCHSVVGQQLLLVDWKTTHGLVLTCGMASCAGTLVNARTNFSKNKALFPMFMIDGPPIWCVVQTLACSCCKRNVKANDSETLCRLPAFVAADYPVDLKYAVGGKHSHIGRGATNVFDQIMTTYANGDLCSRLLCSALNNAHLEKVAKYHSYFTEKNAATATVKPYIQKNGQCIKLFPPTGETIRDLFDDAMNNKNTPWGISDHDRHTREIQRVACQLTMAQDHTFDVLHNYQKKLGASALWDVATETGEIATAVLVPSTKTIHFAHAAQQLARRDNFDPKVMCSDTCPNKSSFWPLLFDGVEGRLGLFHFIQRIKRTMRKNHVDYSEASTALLDAIYVYHSADFEAVIDALKKGQLGKKIHSDDDIAELRGTRLFQQRYGKYIRKIIRPLGTMIQLIDDWFVRFKVTASEGSRPARGRLDPRTRQTLFKAETKSAVEECKKKAQYVCDPLPIDEMYFTIQPNPNSKHQLPQHLSRRVESKLESFHDNLSHFANCGMRSSLCDNLNLCGTARYNLSMRQKLLLTHQNTQKEAASRKNIPSAWEDVVPCYNHAELEYVNNLARQAGSSSVPFSNVETLPDDNGERFFSECIIQINPLKQQCDSLDRCICHRCCSTVPTKTATQQNNKPSHDINTTTDCTNTNTTAPTGTRAEQNSEECSKIIHTTQQTHRQTSTPATSTPASIAQRPMLLPKPPPPPQQQQHNPSLGGAAFFAPAVPMVMPFIFPYPWMVATTTPHTQPPMSATAAWCCNRHAVWLTQPNRAGRPPHDPHCQVRIRAANKERKKTVKLHENPFTL